MKSLRKIFGPKRDAESGLTIPHNEEFCDIPVCKSPSIGKV
jgi:hypothetical protein